MTSPVDVHRADGGIEVKLYVRAYDPNGVPYADTIIQSIRVIHVNSFCRIPPPAGFEWVNQGVKVELYTGENATGTKIGTVFYGHLVGRIEEGVYSFANGLFLGYLGSGICNCNCYPLYDAPYTHHIHMARSSENNAYTDYRNCNTSVGPSSSVYYWLR